MNITQYNDDINNSQIEKLDLCGSKNFINQKENILISLSFNHRGIYDSKRIFLDVFPIELLDSNANIFTESIESNKFILFNSYSYSHQYTFKSNLKIDTENRMVELDIVEMPMYGISIMSDEEKNGIKVSY